MDPSPYPATPGARSRWIIDRRGSRPRVDPWQPARSLLEEERAEDGRIVSSTTLFLVNRECPWRCLMCDLWRYTFAGPTPVGAIPAQITGALQNLTPTHQLKLYNSGSFFDPQAIPPEELPTIADLARSFQRLIVECHPALIGDPILRFRDRLGPTTPLEIALGLETSHPAVLEKLNKRMSLQQFTKAAEFLHRHGIALRAFVLVRPPFLTEAEGLEWAVHSTRFAQDCRASVVTLIPTRPGNGALDALARSGLFTPPGLSTLEQALAAGIGLDGGRVFADLWDLEPFADCPACYAARRRRLEQMNLQQIVIPPTACPHCSPL